MLGSVARKYAHKIPFLVKLNHNELLTLPEQVRSDHVSPASKQALDMGAVAVGATIYFGSAESDRQISRSVASAFAAAHELGLVTVLWCYLRNHAFKTAEKDYHVAADLTGQANHLGVTIQADIIKQKLPENNGGYNALEVRQDRQARLLRTDARRSSHRADALPAGQLLHGPQPADQQRRRRRARTTSPRPSRTAVINKRAGGMGLISGRKAFQRPMADGVKLLNVIQDVYLNKNVTLA